VGAFRERPDVLSGLMSKRDYYEVLGVAKGATDDQIRAAYRKLARQYHPDVNKSPDATKKFAEVQEAYDTLSDAPKRRVYDAYGHDGPEASRPGAGATGRSARARWGNVGSPGGMGSLDPDEMESMFETLFGGRGGFGGPRRAPAEPESRTEIHVPFVVAARGGTQQLRLTENGRTKTIEVKIPPATDDGAQLRVRGAADGDLIITVRTQAHPRFRRGEHAELGTGLDLFLDLPLSIAEATLGGRVEVPTLEGSMELTVPAGSGSGRKLRVRGRGLTDASGKKGDFYVVVQVVPPAGVELSPEEKDMLRRIAEKGSAVRPSPEWPGGR
jgi:curved DNA-binding protein